MTQDELTAIKANGWTYCKPCGAIIMDCVAEIERLRGLVKSAHREGFAAIEGFAVYDADDELWAVSESRTALEAEE